MSSGSPPRIRHRKWLILLGGLPLLAAMLVDTVAVIGRHARMPLNGSIELVQLMLAISGAAAMLVATLAGAHAAVRILIDRLPESSRDWASRVSDVVSALYFAALAAGGIWLAIDMWFAYEQSELLGLPYRPLRMATNLGLAGVAVVFLLRAVSRRRG